MKETKQRRSDDARRAAAAAFQAVKEPNFGGAGVATLTFRDGAGQTFATRRFDGDDTLDRVIRFLATCDLGVPRVGWRVATDTTPPSFWCDGWALTDATTGANAISEADVAKTLQALGLWPSAVLKVEDLAAPPPPPPPPAPTAARPGAGRTVGPKPKPSDLFRRVEARHAPLPKAPDHKPNIAVSADRVPGLPRLLAMGFPEDKARAALRRSNGDVNAAVASLL